MIANYNLAPFRAAAGLLPVRGGVPRVHRADGAAVGGANAAAITMHYNEPIMYL